MTMNNPMPTKVPKPIQNPESHKHLNIQTPESSMNRKIQTPEDHQRKTIIERKKDGSP